MIENVNLFDGHIPYYKITKPIRLIELFAGIGSQHQALKNLGVKIDRSTIVEWQVNSIQAYNDIHIRKYDDHTQGLTKEDLAKRLSDYGVSIDYNQPAKIETLMRKGEEWLRNVYNNIINTNNKVNIMSVKGKDLEITETDKYDYVLTYSFPCQDLSKAGLRKGMSDTNTRSGLLWEVERILSECKELPQILLMENVPDVIGSKFIKDFQRWESRLRELGYSNHTEILNSKDFGIPQNRERAFMVSILGSSLYHFPQKQPLKLRLKDMLEKEVDEKYYLTNEKIQSISQWKAQQDPLENMEHIAKTGISPTLTARGAGEEHSGMVLIKEDTTLGYALAHEGDGVYTNRPEQKRGVVQKQMIQTIKANSNDLGVVVKESGYSEYSQKKILNNIVDKNDVVGTITANAMVSFNHDNCHMIVEKAKTKETIVYDDYNSSIRKDQDTIGTLTTNIGNDAPRNGYKLIENQLRIRKLTPRECYRLMGFGDQAFDLAQPNQSNSSLYHQAGDSIVVNVLMELFRSLL
jgi:DNA (cytosine-5)-methyltransferase 1